MVVAIEWPIARGDRQSMNSGRVDEARQPTWGADMATNTTVLIIVTTLPALGLAGMLVGVACKTRTQQRNIKGEAIRDQAGEDALRLRPRPHPRRAISMARSCRPKAVRSRSRRDHGSVGTSNAVTSWPMSPRREFAGHTTHVRRTNG